MRSSIKYFQTGNIIPMGNETNYAALYYTAAGHSPETFADQVTEYPASSLARFLLLYHQKRTGDPDFDLSAGQIGMYINNPFWIRYQLSQPVTDNPLTQEAPLSSETMTGSGDEYPQYQEPSNPAAMQEPAFTEEGTAGHGGSESEPETAGENGADPFRQDPADRVAARPEEEFAGNSEVTLPVHTGIAEGDRDVSPVLPSGKTAVADPGVEHTHTPDEPQDFIAESAAEGSGQHEAREEPETHSKEEPTHEFSANAPVSIPSAIGGMEEAKRTDHPGEALAFEPLHTVDYFASQGIRISEESLENDQLGRQVKSFTAWLKSMKKLHPGQLPEQNEVIEKIIQSSAEASNNEANVLTEAMAEVLVKQDKREKAVEMYEKLSLLNPSKSAYFAAKIESLKSS
jgi:hypothetical protein